MAQFYCKSCGKEVLPEAEYCPHCGKEFSAVKCPRCGFTGELELFRSGCPSCSYSGKTENPSKKTSKGWSLNSRIAARLIIPSLLLLALLLFMFYKQL